MSSNTAWRDDAGHHQLVLLVRIEATKPKCAPARPPGNRRCRSAMSAIRDRARRRHRHETSRGASPHERRGSSKCRAARRTRSRLPRSATCRNSAGWRPRAECGPAGPSRTSASSAMNAGWYCSRCPTISIRACFSRGRSSARPSLERQRQRLFDEHVLAGLERGAPRARHAVRRASRCATAAMRGIGQDFAKAARRNAELVGRFRASAASRVAHGGERAEFGKIAHDVLAPIAAPDGRDRCGTPSLFLDDGKGGGRDGELADDVGDAEEELSSCRTAADRAARRWSSRAAKASSLNDSQLRLAGRAVPSGIDDEDARTRRRSASCRPPCRHSRQASRPLRCWNEPAFSTSPVTVDGRRPLGNVDRVAGLQNDIELGFEAQHRGVGRDR